MDLFFNAVIIGLGIAVSMFLLPFISLALVGVVTLIAIMFEKIKGN